MVTADIRSWMSTVAVLALMTTIASTACSTASKSSASDPTTAPSPRSILNMEQGGATSESGPAIEGAILYAANCQTCHGDQDGVGRIEAAPTHNETGHTWHHPDAQLRSWVLDGKFGYSQMPGFKDTLTNANVESILTYIKIWWTSEQRESQADVSVRYQEALDKIESSK